MQKLSVIVSFSRLDGSSSCKEKVPEEEVLTGKSWRMKKY